MSPQEQSANEQHGIIPPPRGPRRPRAYPRKDSTVNKLLAAVEQHFVEVDGRIYTDIAFDYAYWSEYLAVFNEVEPIARVRPAERVPEGWLRADGPHVRFHKVYDYLGFWHFLRCFPRVLGDCRRATREKAAVLLQVGNIAQMCWLHLLLARRPYAFEVVGHPAEASRPVKNVQILGLNRVIGFVGFQLCRAQAARAACASYVSNYLQTVFPTRSGREWVFSNVKLPESEFRTPRPAGTFEHVPKHILSVGRVEPEKGHHVLVQAVAELKRRGEDRLRLDIVGPGREIEPLRRLCQQWGVAERVRILGFVSPGEPFQALMDQADLFVLPSFTEGMPRALLEAMARGTPAVGSHAGGIIEVLPEDCLVPPGDASALADKIADVLASPARLAEMSRRNVEIARRFHQDTMNQRKHEFWRCIWETQASARVSR
ncbi:MAG: glycosyltransferase family 4 protein [Planctomycetota bacterium]